MNDRSRRQIISFFLSHHLLTAQSVLRIFPLHPRRAVAIALARLLLFGPERHATHAIKSVSLIERESTISNARNRKE